jgi:hypothetical protein
VAPLQLYRQKSISNQSIISSESKVSETRGLNTLGNDLFKQRFTFGIISTPEKKRKGNKSKKSSSKRLFSGFSNNNVYILPDLGSVSETEAKNYSRYGFGEAIAPKATTRVKALSSAAFGGFGGFVPTEQMRKKLRI